MSGIKGMNKKVDIRIWPVKGTKQHMDRLNMMKEGSRIFERFNEDEENNREEWIKEFNKINSKNMRYGLSDKRIKQFMSGNMKGRNGNSLDWHKHWIESIEKYQNRKKNGTLKAKEYDKEETEEELEEEIEEEDIIIDRTKLSFEERVNEIVENLENEILFVNKNKRKIEDPYKSCFDVISLFEKKIDRWEENLGEIKRDKIDIKRILDILDLNDDDGDINNNEFKSSRDIWITRLNDLEYNNKEEILMLVECNIFGGYYEVDYKIYLDDIILEKLILKCLQITGLEDIGILLFKLGIGCGDYHDTCVMEIEPETVYETASRINKLMCLGDKMKAEPLGRLHTLNMTSQLHGRRAVEVGVGVCTHLARLRKGEAMLWASHVVVAQAAVAAAGESEQKTRISGGSGEC